MTEEIVVRCKNCLERFSVEPGAEKATCPHCNKEWRISWPRPGQATIRGAA